MKSRIKTINLNKKLKLKIKEFKDYKKIQYN